MSAARHRDAGDLGAGRSASHRTGRFASDGVTLQVRRHRALLAVAALVLGIPVAALAGLVVEGDRHVFAALLAVGFTVVVAAVAVLVEMRFEPLVSAPPRSREPAELAFLVDGALLVRWDGGQRRYPPGAVLEGWVEGFSDVVSVVLRMRGDELITFTAEDAAEAREVLDVAGVSPDQRALRVRLAPETGYAGRRFLPWGLSSIALLLARTDLTTLLAVGVILVVLVLLWPALTHTQVLIGAEGLTLERPLARRFIPFQAVVGVEVEHGAVVVVTPRERVRLPTGPRPGAEASYEQAAVQAVLFDRLQEVRDVHERRSTERIDLGVLDRRGRSLPAWRAALRRVGAAESSYRLRAVPREALEAVVVDASATAERRLGAAMALSVSEAAGRRSIERAVDACADSRLRAALAAAAADSLAEEEMEAALEADGAAREAAR